MTTNKEQIPAIQIKIFIDDNSAQIELSSETVNYMIKHNREQFIEDIKKLIHELKESIL